MFEAVLVKDLQPRVRELLAALAAKEGVPGDVETSLGGDDFTLFAFARVEHSSHGYAKVIVSAACASNDFAIYVAAAAKGKPIASDWHRATDSDDLACRVAESLAVQIGGGEVRQELEEGRQGPREGEKSLTRYSFQVPLSRG